MYMKRQIVILIAAALAYPACAADEAPADASKPAAPANIAAAITLPAANAKKSFHELTKGATRKDGLIPVWIKEEKVYLELTPDMIGKPFLFTVNRVQGIGEGGIYGGEMGTSNVASFRKTGDRIQLIAHNLAYTAQANTPEAVEVKEGFSDSLLSAATVVSLPHPDSKSILIEAPALLFTDLGMGVIELEHVYRQTYAFDPRQSTILRTRADNGLTAVEVQANYTLPKIAQPNPLATGRTQQPTLPKTVRDPRNLFMTWMYSFASLPDAAPVRLADDRVGFFTTTRWDFSDDRKVFPRVHYLNRWRIEKADPDAPVSDAKSPVVYWLDKNIPERYRDAVESGVLAWNKAFEKIGIRNALVVKQQPADADFDNSEARRASIRWYLGTDVGAAVGPSKTDPRTGEILSANIVMSEVFTRSAHRLYRDQQQDGVIKHGDDACEYAALAAAEQDFAFDVLAAREDIDPDSPEALAFVKKRIKDVIMHEVGHTLGLRHNFKASTAYTFAQLSDPAFTATHGISASVMDYVPANLALKGEKQADYYQNDLGPYDYWAIAYGYTPFKADAEKDGLAKIAARSTEPLLAFASDEEAGGGDNGSDPAANRFDLSADPLAYYERRIKLTHELWERLIKRKLKDGESYADLRRSFESGLSNIRTVGELSTKYVGGITHVRDHAGSGRMPLTAVAADQQRRALKLIAREILSTDSFTLPPDFMRKLTPDLLEMRGDFHISLPEKVLSLQDRVLNGLYNRKVAENMLDYEHLADRGSHPLKLSEVYDTLQAAIWQEVRQNKPSSTMRRNLQREHLKLLIANLTLPIGLPADARSLLRDNARTLSQWLASASQAGGLDKESRAHYLDARASIDEALKASYSRVGV
ncbi:zinc-dependent metalloprotease [Burkholderiaceae bacterium DAT-1]|nr:zinc-dependent metalloprotease [Burkholderiaceae bacterium DAT-1]